jgi:hypothetical protein
MATEENVNGIRSIELTSREAASVICLLGVQIGDEYLPHNYYSYSSSAAFVRIFGQGGNVDVRMFLIIDWKPRDVSGEVVEGDETIIILSRVDAANIIGSLANQLAKGGGNCASVSVQDRGRELYRLVWSVIHK